MKNLVKRLGEITSSIALIFIGSSALGDVIPVRNEVAHRAWQADIAKMVSSQNKGCFQSSYPSIQLKNISCAPPAPSIPVSSPPATRKLNNFGSILKQTTASSGFDAGNGFDYVLHWDHNILFANSSINATGVTSIAGPGNNEFTLQLNTNYSLYAPALCSGALYPFECTGWEQVVVANNSPYYGNRLFIQYWLLNYGRSNCPSGWTSYSGSCYRNSSNSVLVPGVTASNFYTFHNIGLSANAGIDSASVEFTNASGGITLYGVIGDNPFNLSQAQWTDVETNFFGDGGGSQVNFNNTTEIVFDTSVEDSIGNGQTDMDAPTCSTQGFTGETNNLYIYECETYGGNTIPGMKFNEGFGTTPLN